MADSGTEKTPPFNVGDKVRVTSPTPERGKEGVIIEVLDPLGDLVYRYRVQFSDGSLSKVFGFELKLSDSQSNPNAYDRAS